MNSDQAIVLVETKFGSDWGSCLTIMPNLAKAYEVAFGRRLHSVNYGKQSSTNEILATAEQILKLNPSHLVFTDHQKHPYDLLMAIDCVFKRRKWPALIFHVYGDFTLYTPEWAKTEKLLLRKSVHFICASARQRNLLSTFIPNVATTTSVCPFPISAQEFQWRSGLRESERQEKGYALDEFIMVYTGRLSLQKNILKMVSDIAHTFNKSKTPWRLILAGTFDDIGEPFFGVRLEPGAYYEAFQQLLDTLGSDLASRIDYVGALGKRELHRLYHAADLFVSFSTHHDEDFGMSPAEALCCGTKALITDWGGYQGFAIDGSSVRLIPVHFEKSGVTIKSDNLSLILKEFNSTPESDSSRRARSITYIEKFSIDAASAQVAQLLANDIPKFRAFKPFLKKHSRLRKLSENGVPMFRLGARPDVNYVTLYKNYVCETKEKR